jgi:hypothetical protein
MPNIVITKVVWDMHTMKVVERRTRAYSGPWMLCKGDNSLKAGEQQQLAFNQQLQNAFMAQYGKQSAQIDYLNSILKPMVTNPTGLSQPALTAMRTSASDTIAREGQNAKSAVAATEAARGGGTGLPSGVEAQLDEGVALNTANQQSTAQNQITQYDESVRQTNLWNAINGLQGNARMLDPTAYSANANQGSSALAGLGTAYYNTQQSGWLNAALGGLGAVGAAFAGKPPGGGGGAGAGGGGV